MDIKEDQLQNIWDAVTDKFTNDDMNSKKEHVLQHMRRLWNNWSGSLHKNMKSKPFCDALKDVPRGIDKCDWEWLVKEHFLIEKFKETSTRNYANRSKLSMAHRTGSKPIREIIYELLKSLHMKNMSFKKVRRKLKFTRNFILFRDSLNLR